MAYITKIEGTESVLVESRHDTIYDNTAAEADNIETQTLRLRAATGIGEVWQAGGNLNVSATEVSALNSVSGGINIQNRLGFAVGEEGIANTGSNQSRTDGDVVLVSAGKVFYDRMSYDFAGGGRGSITNLPSQSIFLIHNLNDVAFSQQWGNQISQLISQLLGSGRTSVNALRLASALEEEVASASVMDVLAEMRYSTSARERMVAGEGRIAKQGSEVRAITVSDLVRHGGGIRMLNILQTGAEATMASAITLPNTSFSLEGDTGLDMSPVDASLSDWLLPMDDETNQNSDQEDGLDGRPVVRDALELADDALDLPLIAAE